MEGDGELSEREALRRAVEDNRLEKAEGAEPPSLEAFYASLRAEFPALRDGGPA